jgi:outer membrane protein
MRNLSARPTLFLAGALVLSAGFGSGLMAAEVSRPASSSLYEPQVLKLPGNRVSLLDAIRITLENDPNIRIAEQQRLGSKGIFQTETGAFDSSIQGSAQWLFTQQALTLSQKSAEQKNRTDIEKDIADSQKLAGTFQTQVNELTKLAANPATYAITVPDPTLTLVQAFVDTKNLQIAAETDPAKKAALISQRDAYIALNLAQAQSNLGSQNSETARATKQRADLGDVPKTVQQNNLTMNLQASFPYRDGVTLGLTADGSYSRNRYKGKEKQATLGGEGIEDLYTVDIGFTINASLLRGRGSDATGAAEKAAQVDYEASELTLKHQASTSVLNTVAAYWNLVASQEILEAAKRSSGVQGRRLEITDALISADEIPRAERARGLASRASSDALVASAERTVNEARVALALAMGVAVEGEANAPFAADTFPPEVERDLLSSLQPAPLVSLAFQRRYDRQASIKLIDSGGILLRQAETGLRPKLDVSGQVSANSTAETSLAQLANAWTAPGIQAGLSFEKPVGNNAARGVFAQRRADLGQRAINSRDLDRNIQANIVQILASLRAAADQTERAREAVEAYEKTIDAEGERFKSGETSLLDSILTQDLQTSALVTYAQARQTYASLLARLRYETGTLLGESAGGNVVREDFLLHLPHPTQAK